jgi:hypothetical protein
MTTTRNFTDPFKNVVFKKSSDSSDSDEVMSSESDSDEEEHPIIFSK